MKITGWIRFGDKAACGGTVAEGSAVETSHGRGYTFQGARIDCRKNCVIADGFTRSTLSNGRNRVIHGQMTGGGCALRSTLNDIDGVGDEAGVAIAEKLFVNTGEWTEQPHDEQPQLRSARIGGVPYFIETMDGRTLSGRAETDGLLSRIDTHGEGDYSVYWGDEALVRMEASQT